MPPETMPKQLSLSAGGATVDVSEIAGFGFAAGTKKLDGEFKKGADVEVTLRCRVTAVKLVDQYDSQGNVAVTVREHTLRVDEVASADLVNAQAYRTPPEQPPEGPEDPAPEA